MKRQAALERAVRHYDSGAFLAELASLVAVPSESQEARIPELKPRGDPAGGQARARGAARAGRARHGRAGDRPGLGRARPHAGREAVRLEILAWTAGDPKSPVNAVPPSAAARCQIRYTVDSDPAEFLPAIRRALDDAGLGRVEVRPGEAPTFRATRTDPEHTWVTFVRRSIERTTGRPPAVLPNLGGSLPNDCFAEVLGVPTIWVPHSYRGCCQHAPNEHALPAILREGLLIMTGLFWDLGESGRPT